MRARQIRKLTLLVFYQSRSEETQLTHEAEPIFDLEVAWDAFQ